MTAYLIFDTPAEAEARSRAAWVPAPDDAITVQLWMVVVSPADGRAALVVPAETEGALTDAERAALVPAFIDIS